MVMLGRGKIWFTPMRIKRFASFCIDLAVIGVLLTLMYEFFQLPDFPAVLTQMREINATAVPDAEAVRRTLDLFGDAFFQTLIIYFGYEVVCEITSNGRTLGRWVLGFRLAPLNSKRGRFFATLMYIGRSALKMLLMYLIQGIPFLIAVLHIFTDEKNRTAYDRAFRLIPVLTREHKADQANDKFEKQIFKP